MTVWRYLLVSTNGCSKFLGYTELIAILVYNTHLTNGCFQNHASIFTTFHHQKKRSLLDYYHDDTKVPKCLGCMHLLSVRLFKTFRKLCQMNKA
jgi:hypothetical protein